VDTKRVDELDVEEVRFQLGGVEEVFVLCSGIKTGE
jgi:hypothetical protein